MSEHSVGLIEAPQIAATRALFDSVEPGEFATMAAPEVAASLGEKLARTGLDGLPKVVANYLGHVPSVMHGHALDAVSQGIAAYAAAHGRRPEGDTVAGILSSVAGMADKYSIEARQAGRHIFAMDSVNASGSGQSNNWGLHPGAVMTAVLQMAATEIPFAGRIAADSGFATFRTGVLRNVAASNFGDYAAGDSLDGVMGAGEYIDSERVVTLTVNGGMAAAVTGVVKTRAGGSTELPLLAGASEIRVNGMVIGAEANAGVYGSSVNRSSGAGAYALAGSVQIAGTTYTLSDSTITPSTGAYSVKFSAELPAGTVVELVVYANYEANPDLAPVIGAEVDLHEYAVTASRAKTRATLDAFQQASAELGVDLFSAANWTVRAKYMLERYARVVKQLVLAGRALPGEWDMDWAAQKDQKNIAQVMVDLFPVLAKVSTSMAVATQDHGGDTLLVTGLFAQYLDSLPNEVFERSGLVKGKDVVRVGRLKQVNLDVYYVPAEFGWLPNNDAAGTTTALMVGRGTTTAKCPIIVADPIAPMLTPLADGQGGQMQNFFYVKGGAKLNRSTLFRQGAATITITGLAG
ncbi:hypothetical protein [Ideonella livida]|uniref:Uncharacterized protein n=1 Tax=Ideonella livida TaxID=2707176 RepID=A0A7C9TGI6_9BURK|nr:hypothetical protein [Ideonella livida]NDY89698.1 hypothetical protein [Ideonella livida]